MSDATTAIAIDLGGTNARAARVRADGTVEARGHAHTPSGDGPEAVLDVLVALADEVRGGQPVAGVGLGFPGFLALPEGRVIRAPNLHGWDGFPLEHTLRDRLQLPVFLENDANAAAWGELHYGAASGASHFAQITLGTGLGCGLVLDGRLYHGESGMAGELGHIPVQLDGDFVCGCGNRGCLESLASQTGFRNHVRAAWEAGTHRDSALYALCNGQVAALELQPAAEAARTGDVLARESFEHVGRYLGMGLAVLANALNLEMVVLGGGVAGAWDLFIDATRAELARHALSAVIESMEIRPSELGDDAGLLGAAALALADD